MNTTNILVTQTEFLATVTINRPNKLNALNKETIQELHDVFKSLEAEKQVQELFQRGQWMGR